MVQRNRRSGKLMVIVAVVAALVGAGGGVFVGPKLMKPGAAKTGKAQAAKPGTEKASARETTEHAAVVPLGDFLVNLAAGSQVRYLRAEVAIAVAGLPEPEKKGGHGGGGKAPALPDAEMATARDRVVAVLSAGDAAALEAAAGREKLKQQVQSKLQEALPDYELTEVLFTSFVMQ